MASEAYIHRTILAQKNPSGEDRFKKKRTSVLFFTIRGLTKGFRQGQDVMFRFRHRTPGKLRLLAGLFLLAGCQGDPAPLAPVTGPIEAPAPPNLTLLALGDSYTVGQGARGGSSWPAQLVAALAVEGDTLKTTAVIAESGWNTGDLLGAVAQRFEVASPTPPFGLVTLMIGANNQFQGVPLEETTADWIRLLDQAVTLAGGQPGQVLAVSIPDFSVTPLGGLLDPAAVSRDIDVHNARLDTLCRARGIDLIDITPLSRQAGNDPSLVARDGLHYTAEMYRRWVGLILPAARDRLHHVEPGE